MTDTATASLLRERFLEPHFSEVETDVTIDLNGMRQLSLDAADELVGIYVQRLRKRDPQARILVVARSRDVLRSINAALRDRRTATLGVFQRDRLAEDQAVEEKNTFLPLGDISSEEREAFNEIDGGQANPEHNVLYDRLRLRGLLVETDTGFQVPQPGEAALVEYA